MEELEKNPELAKPKFKNVPWKIVTYRGQLPISQEAIDDSGVDLTALVANYPETVIVVNVRRTAATREFRVLRSICCK